MRFVGTEPHPNIPRSDLFTFECLCGETLTEAMVRH
jgi:hypothetical protein